MISGQEAFARALKPQLGEIQSELGEFGTYLIENVAACKQSGISDLFTREQAIDILAYTQSLSNDVGSPESKKGTAQDINEALPEIMELQGIVKTIKLAISTDTKVEPDAVKRYFYLSARVINFINLQIKESGV